MMKKVIYLVVLAAFIAGCNSQPHFVVNGKIAGSDSLTFLLQKRGLTKYETIDSVVSKNGNFKMEGKVEYPDMVTLTAMNTGKRMAFFLENSKIEITGKLDSLANAKVTGSKTQDEYNSFLSSMKGLSDKSVALFKDYQIAGQANDTAKQSSLEKERNAIESEMTKMAKDYIKNNPASYFTPLLLASMSSEMEPDEIEAGINSLDTNVAKVQVIKDLKERTQAVKKVAVGQKAPDFTMNDVNGNPVSLSSKIGSKLLLVDFWAAWCHPCRMENPNVVKVYNEFHKKGFDVLGVSLDRSKEDWIKAIADDKLTWTHVSDLQYWDNAAAKLYAVGSIPANFLLDENGTIIATNLREDDLYNKVKEILEKLK
jgi:peroxiredoxin